VEILSRLGQEPIKVSQYWTPIFDVRLGFAKNNCFFRLKIPHFSA